MRLRSSSWKSKRRRLRAADAEMFGSSGRIIRCRMPPSPLAGLVTLFIVPSAAMIERNGAWRKRLDDWRRLEADLRLQHLPADVDLAADTEYGVRWNL